MTPTEIGIPKTPRRAATKPFTVREVDSAKPEAKRYLLWEPGSLVLEVLPTARKSWRTRYVKAGKQHWYTLGTYPAVTLAEARERLAEVKRSISHGHDPTEARRAARTADRCTFATVTAEWLEVHASATNAKTAGERRMRLERHVLPGLGDLPISDITPAVALAVIKRIEARGALHTARRMLQDCVAIGDYAISTSRLTANPFSPLRKALKSEQPAHFAAIVTPDKFGALLRAIDGYNGDAVTRYALQLAALFFVRSNELRNMKWSAIDLGARQWTLIAAEKKEKRPHIVPLCDQALRILAELKPITGGGEYVLGSRLGGSRPLSDNTLNAAMRRMGIGRDEHTTHGFRAAARTILDEVLKYPVDVIEHQLAHNVRDALGRAYNRTTKLPERAAMMQAWGDYLDRLRQG